MHIKVILILLLMISCKPSIVYRDNARYYKQSYSIENVINYNLYCSANTCKLVFSVNHTGDIIIATKVLLIIDKDVVSMTYDKSTTTFYTIIDKESKIKDNILSIYLYYLDENSDEKLYRIHEPSFLNKRIKSIL